jgi:FkbM family methyltransferase
MLKKIAKEIAPHGVVKLVKKRRDLQNIGCQKQLWNPRTVIDRHRAARETGLLMLPNGTLPDLHTFVDIGANEGEWIDGVLKCANPTKVFAFEPDPTALKAIQPKFETDSRIQIIEAAVGSSEGTVLFNVAASNKLSSVLKPADRLHEMYGDDADVSTEKEVRIIRLDKELSSAESVSMVKIDVQGYETEVINGAVNTLKKSKFILVEANWEKKYEKSKSFAEIHQILTSRLPFRLLDMAGPLSSSTGASYSDALYQNVRLI